MERIEYKGYVGEYEYNEGQGIYIGKIVGITDLVTFEASCVKVLEREFMDAVDDYIDIIQYLNTSD